MGLLSAEGERLFTKHMLAFFCSLKNLGTMCCMRRAKNHRIDCLKGEHTIVALCPIDATFINKTFALLSS
ncbi:MAG: hypothetical protein EBW14_19540 [Oxalobacteraceae bacterium]|nr:hypothetical protein [Oxalobacteraceae bacterium]